MKIPLANNTNIINPLLEFLSINKPSNYVFYTKIAYLVIMALITAVFGLLPL